MAIDFLSHLQSDGNFTLLRNRQLVWSQTIAAATSKYTAVQTPDDVLLFKRTGDTTGDGAVFSLVEIQSPTIDNASLDSEATLTLTTRSGAAGGLSRALDIYNDEYGADNGMGMRQLYKNTTPNPIRVEYHDKTVNNGKFDLLGCTVTNGSTTVTFTSSSGVTPSVEDWIWDNFNLYIANDTKIISVVGNTITLSKPAIGTGTGVALRGKNIREIFRTNSARQTLFRKWYASFSNTVAEFGGHIQVDGDVNILGQFKVNGVAIASGGKGAMSILKVAAANATTSEKANADYICDGTADNVEINTALGLVKTAGGIVQLSTGTFNLAAPVYIEGINTVDSITTGIIGAGIGATNIIGASGIDPIVMRFMPKPVICNLSITVTGAADAIKCIANTTGANDRRGFWCGEFKNIFISGTGSHSGWALNLENPFRSVFYNIQTGSGVGNGMRLASTYSAFNPGNLVFMVCQMGIDGVNNTGYKLETADNGGFFNICTFIECDYFNGSTGSTTARGWWFKGSGTSYFTTREIRIRGSNVEEANTCFHLDHVDNIHIEANYCNTKNNGKVFDFSADSKNNFCSVDYIYVPNAITTNAYTDLNTDVFKPNHLFHSNARVETGGTMTMTPSSVSVIYGLARDTDGSGSYPAMWNHTRTPLLVKDEGVTLFGSGTSSINFAGAGVTATSTNGDVTVTIPGGGAGSSPLTTKGDLFTYDTAAARLPVGLPGQVLTADPATSTGMGWKTPANPTAQYTQLTGYTTNGTSGAGGTFDKAWDGNDATFFDATAGNGAYTGVDLGVGVTKVLTKLSYLCRPGFGSRMTGGIFSGSNDDITYTPLHTVVGTPVDGVYTDVIVANSTPYRYYRYTSPNSGFGNVAEIKLYETAASITKGVITVTIPAGAGKYEHVENILNASVSPTSIVLLSLAPHTDADENSPEMLNINTMVAVPKAGSYDAELTFDDPTAGAIKLYYNII